MQHAEVQDSLGELRRDHVVQVEDQEQVKQNINKLLSIKEILMITMILIIYIYYIDTDKIPGFFLLV